MPFQLNRSQLMIKATTRLSSFSSHLFAIAIYLALGLLLLKYFNYIWAKDEICYISIAQKYARGEFRLAPNAFWPPMLSWLLAVPIFLGVPPALAAKLLPLLIGVFTYFAVRSLSYTFNIGHTLRTVILYSLIPILLYCSLIHFTPDLLLVGLLTAYFSVILSSTYPDRPRVGWLCGVLGALSYFTKSYAFFFFLLHFPLASVVHYAENADKRRRQIVLRNLVSGLIAFAVLTAAWVCALNFKYHVVTIGVNGKYNYRKAGPDSQGNPNGYTGFVAPPDPTAVSHWEEPYSYFSDPEVVSCCLKPWSPFESWKSFKYQIKLIYSTGRTMLALYQRLSALTITILLSSLVLCVGDRKQLVASIELALGLATFCCYSGGYSLLHVEERYLWPMWILLMLMGAKVLHELLKAKFFDSTTKRGLLLVAFSASFVLPSLDGLKKTGGMLRQIGGNTYALSKLLEHTGLKGARVAANNDYGTAVGIAYRLGAKFYGVAKPNSSENEIVEELKKNGIQYYFVFNQVGIENRVTSPALEQVNKLQGLTKAPSLTVYSVKY
jgi:hypothetical protein